MNKSFGMRLFWIGISLLVLTSVSSVAQDQTPLIQRFESPEKSIPDGWSVFAGDWRVEDGALIADSMDSESYITLGETAWQNYEIEASVAFRKVRNSSRWLSVIVRGSNDGTPPWSQVPIRFDTTQSNGMEFAVRTKSADWSIREVSRAPLASKLGSPRQLKVIVRGTRIEGFLDGDLIISSDLCVDRPTGCIGLGASGCVASFDNVSISHLPDTDPTARPPRRRSDNVAHRGFSAVAPENTLAAIRAAVKAGATGCEFDVYRSKDGTVVLMHDKTVDRTTDGSGPVTELSLKQLRGLDAGSWKDKKFAGESVPTLSEALQVLKGSGCQPVIEIKMEGISQQVVNDVRALEMVDQVAVIAFSENVVREIRELEPKITCAWLCGKTLRGTTVQQADWLESRARVCKARLFDLNFKMLSPALVTELKRRGFGVWTWTVNEATVMQALHRWGVDSITTDRPDLLSASLGTL